MKTALDKLWLQHYPVDVAKELPPIAHSNLADFLQEMFEKFADKEGFRNFERSLTFAEMGERARAFAAYLQQAGYKKGDRLALMMPNILQYLVALYGAFMAGVIVVNVNPLYTPDELRMQLLDSEVRGILVAENFAHTLSVVKKDLPALREVFITKLGDELGVFKGLAVNLAAKYLTKMVSDYELPEAVFYKEMLNKGRSYQLVKPSLQLDDVAVLQYTGGTTGIAKGAILTHANLLANTMQIGAWLGKEKAEGEVLITALPLYHVFSFMVNGLTLPARGMRSVLITNPRDLKGFVRTLSKHPFSVMTGVNTLFKGLLNQAEFARLDFSYLRFVVAGGMPLEQGVSERWHSMTGNMIIEGYGLTEAPVSIVNFLFNDAYTGGIGYPITGTEVSIVDSYGHEVGVGEVGELRIRGPHVMRGYWRQTGETEQVIDEQGWLATGDVVTMDERGFLRLVDRIKDMILVSGFNVYPSEVEAVLASHPAVFEVACVGVASEESGEQVKAFIVLRDGEFTTKDELRNYVKTRLTPYKRPKEYEFLDALPKSNVGKILRRELVAADRQARSL